MELSINILKYLENLYKENKGSILRTIVYTIGHFAIAITVLMLIADVPFMIALTDAIVEPIANSVWYFILDKWWASKVKTNLDNSYHSQEKIKNKNYLIKISK